MPERDICIPSGYTYPATAAWFAAGGAVTAAFSGSLAVLGNCRKGIYQHAGVVSEIPDPIRTRDW